MPAAGAGKAPHYNGADSSQTSTVPWERPSAAKIAATQASGPAEGGDPGGGCSPHGCGGQAYRDVFTASRRKEHPPRQGLPPMRNPGAHARYALGGRGPLPQGATGLGQCRVSPCPNMRRDTLYCTIMVRRRDPILGMEPRSGPYFDHSHHGTVHALSRPNVFQRPCRLISGQPISKWQSFKSLEEHACQQATYST
ncbi:hypothetical protein SAMN05444515_10556 [Ectothiorhodospira marina]|uniref:Uncharacterized protein n=1 Tax=Ectothiorhodospira marina TaxID=1396821 RepID=A0A1H7JWZ1_9GAMM|nr:hypothetical protein SAMN05444515_10556 [Ectothiorhodospira marina]